MLLIAPVVFVDGFLRNTLRKRAAKGYHLGLLNQSASVISRFLSLSILMLCIQEYFKEQSKFFLCQDPHPDEELEIQNIVLAGPFTSLENGKFSCFFAKTQQVESFYGSLYLRFGNNIKHCGSIGLLGPTASFPSRFFEDCPAEKYHKVHPFSRKPRNVKNHKTIIDQIQLDKVTRGKKLTAKKDAKELGLTLERSNMWDIKVFSKNFFWSHTNCYLHLEKEGMLHWWLKYFGIKYGKVVCEAINLELKNLTCELPKLFLPLTHVNLFHSLSF